MIEPNELRIGNLVRKPKYGSVYKIVMFLGIGHLQLDSPYFKYQTDSFHDCSIDEIEGIPLTEEWLLKFRFNKKTVDGVHNDIFEWFKIQSEKGGFEYGFENYQLSIPNVRLHYVHQLQNLYFALTGKELEFKS